MKIQPYLNLDGNCEEAFEFYARTLNGTILMRSRYSEMPADTQPGCGDPESGPGPTAEQMRAAGNKIMHIALQVGADQVIMGSDNPPSFPYTGIHGCTIALSYDDLAEGQHVFEALSEGAHVSMAFGPVFWSEGFGMLTDRFGVPWMVNAGERKTPVSA